MEKIDLNLIFKDFLLYYIKSVSNYSDKDKIEISKWIKSLSKDKSKKSKFENNNNNDH